jgi:hypothetical protein
MKNINNPKPSAHCDSRDNHRVPQHFSRAATKKQGLKNKQQSLRQYNSSSCNSCKHYKGMLMISSINHFYIAAKMFSSRAAQVELALRWQSNWLIRGPMYAFLPGMLNSCKKHI